MRPVSAIVLICAVAFLSACKAGPALADVPARIGNPTVESRAELLRVVRGALNGSTVTIAGNALTNSSLLIIEPKQLEGRDLRKPVQFRLMLSNSHCVLVQQGTGERLELTETQCAAE